MTFKAMLFVSSGFIVSLIILEQIPFSLEGSEPRLAHSLLKKEISGANRKKCRRRCEDRAAPKGGFSSVTKAGLKKDLRKNNCFAVFENTQAVPL